jgi:hypothetical protein
MANDKEREFPELPSHHEIRMAALGYLSEGGHYLACDLKDTLASVLNVTPDQLALRFVKNGRLAFDNYVDHVKRAFSREGIHTGPNGGKHKNPDEPYFVTDHGIAVARQSLDAP